MGAQLVDCTTPTHVYLRAAWFLYCAAMGAYWWRRLTG